MSFNAIIAIDLSDVQDYSLRDISSLIVFNRFLPKFDF